MTKKKRRRLKDFNVTLSTGPCLVDCDIESNLGVAYSGKTIILRNQNVYSQEYLDTCIHEAYHMSLPTATESEVKRVAGDVAQVLWKRGYRLPTVKKKKKTKKPSEDHK